MGEEKKSTRGRKKEWTDEELHKLGEQLVQHCRRPDVYHIVDFISAKNKSQGWYYRLKRENEILQPYHERAKEILGNKIVNLAFKCGNNWAIQTFIPRYLKDVDDYLDQKLQRELELKDALRRASETETENRAAVLFSAVEKFLNAGKNE